MNKFTKESLKEIVDSILASARENFEKDGYLQHVVVMMNETDAPQIIAPVYENQAHKDIIAQQLRDHAAKYNPLLVIQLAEAWMAKVSIKDEKKKKELYDDACKGNIHKRDDGEEIIYAIVESPFFEGGGSTRLAKISRENGIVSLSDWEEISDVGEGRFGRILEEDSILKEDLN